MKILRKLGLTLFSLMLFCGMSMTAFASTPNVSIDAHTGNNNSNIVVRMRSQDGEKHAYRIYATYYDHRGRIIGRNKDEDDSILKRKDIEWSNIKEWEYVKVDMFCDFKYIESRKIERLAYDENGMYIACYVNNDDDIVAKMNFKERVDSKIELTCQDANGNEVYSDVTKDKDRGNSELTWTAVPSNWKYATLRFRINGKHITLGLTK